jgi:hypothetical protein
LSARLPTETSSWLATSEFADSSPLTWLIFASAILFADLALPFPPSSYLTPDSAATFRKLESLFAMPAIFRSWVHAHFYGKRPQLGHIRFCRLCWPDGEPMIQQVELAERDGWPVHTVFEGCVLRPQLLSSVEGGEWGGLRPGSGFRAGLSGDQGAGWLVPEVARAIPFAARSTWESQGPGPR